MCKHEIQLGQRGVFNSTHSMQAPLILGTSPLSFSKTHTHTHMHTHTHACTHARTRTHLPGWIRRHFALHKVFEVLVEAVHKRGAGCDAVGVKRRWAVRTGVQRTLPRSKHGSTHRRNHRWVTRAHACPHRSRLKRTCVCVCVCLSVCLSVCLYLTLSLFASFLGLFCRSKPVNTKTTQMSPNAFMLMTSAHLCVRACVCVFACTCVYMRAADLRARCWFIFARGAQPSMAM